MTLATNPRPSRGTRNALLRGALAWMVLVFLTLGTAGTAPLHAAPQPSQTTPAFSADRTVSFALDQPNNDPASRWSLPTDSTFSSSFIAPLPPSRSAADLASASTLNLSSPAPEVLSTEAFSNDRLSADLSAPLDPSSPGAATSEGHHTRVGMVVLGAAGVGVLVLGALFVSKTNCTNTNSKTASICGGFHDAGYGLIAGGAAMAGVGFYFGFRHSF